MTLLRNLIEKGLILSLSCLLIFLTCFSTLLAKEINWIEVANTGTEIQFIDSNSLKYNNNGFLSVLTKSAKMGPDLDLINTNSYLIAIDCDNRLFSKFPVDGKIKNVKNWKNPINNKLIKTTIVNSCAY